MPDMDPCELCGTPAETVVPSGGYDGIRQRCPRCGDFKLRRTAMVRRLPRSDKVKLSGWVRDQNQLGEVPELTSDRVSGIVASPLPGIVECADRLLGHAIRSQGRLGEPFKTNNPAFVAVTYSDGRDELNYLVQFLSDEGLIKFVAKGETEITPQGYMRYESLQTRASTSAQGFVAMWFNEAMREIYALGFEVGIRQAGYDPLRVDRVEHVGKIDDEIIAQIRRSRF